MFSPRLGLPPASQKNRQNRTKAFQTSPHLQEWTRFIALGQGAITVPFLEKLYIWGKRITRYPTKTMRFWVNLQAAQVITKKPANLRMGKGKGGRAGAVATVSPGAILLAVSFLRGGLVAKICRQISVRTSFKVGASRPTSPFSRAGLVFARTQRRYTATRMYDLRYFFRKANQSHLYAFTAYLFKWARKVPRLKRIPKFNYLATPDEYEAYGSLALFSAFSASKVSWAWATKRQPRTARKGGLLGTLGCGLPFWARQIAPRQRWAWAEPRKFVFFTNELVTAAGSGLLVKGWLPGDALALALALSLLPHFVFVLWLRLFAFRALSRSMHGRISDTGILRRLTCYAVRFSF